MEAPAPAPHPNDEPSIAESTDGPPLFPMSPPETTTTTMTEETTMETAMETESPEAPQVLVPTTMPEEEEDQEAQMVRDFATHPMMSRVQKALVETLKRELERSDAEAKEKMIAVQEEKKRREQVGVELYGVQQQLATLQMNLEALHNDGLALRETRNVEDGNAERARAEHGSLKKALTERETHVSKTQTELDAIHETLRQVEKYNEEMRKEIAVTKRATYKAEESVAALEAAKHDQDVYIDGLEARVKSLNETIAVREARLEKQRGESTDASGMLHETAEEMALITFEKKQLMQQWKASLVQLARRDEALAAAQATLKSARADIQDIGADIDGTKRDIAAARGEWESLRGVIEKHRGEELHLDESLRKVMADYDAAAAQFDLLQRSVQHTEAEEAKVTAEGKQSGESLDQLAAHMQIVTIERQKIETKIAAAKSAKKTVSKAVRNLQKQTAAVKEKAFAKEIDASNLDNEISRVRVDAVNTEMHNEQLRETLDTMVKKLKKQDAMIATYQLEIRQRNDDVEKKMHKVDRLNRKYDKMVANAEEGEHLGPLEATIRNLNKERDAVVNENANLQATWLTDQTSLVSTTQQSDEITEKNNELKAKVRILDEKRRHVLKETSKKETTITAFHSSNAAMRGDVARLNDLLGRHATMQTDLSNEIAVTEAEFKSELRELEAASLKVEQQVSDAKDAKNRLLDEIVDVERQVLLWEKKIQLERETQAALDPSVGTGEIRAMEKEIHRMKIRLDALQREQEKMISDMERAIVKREAIAVRFRGKETKLEMAKQAAKRNKPALKLDGKPTKAALKKQIATLRFSIQQTAKEASELSNTIAQRQRDLQTSTTSLAAATSRYGDLEKDSAKLQAEINTLLYEKQRRAELQSSRDKAASRYLDLERGTATVQLDDDAADAQLQASLSQNRKIKSVIANLMHHFDYLNEPLDRIMRLADDAETPPIDGTADLSIPDD